MSVTFFVHKTRAEMFTGTFDTVHDSANQVLIEVIRTENGTVHSAEHYDAFSDLDEAFNRFRVNLEGAV